VPWLVVQTDFLLGALFAGPGARHYYFGDYFDPRYDKLGFVPWPNYHPFKGGFDPTFAYYRQLHRADAKWEPALRSLYAGRRGGDVPRPPHTLAKQSDALRAIAANNRAERAVSSAVNLTHAQNVTVLSPLRDASRAHVTNLAPIGGAKADSAIGRELKLEPLKNEDHVREQKAAEVLRTVGGQRREAEGKVLAAGGVPVQHTDPAHTIKYEAPKVPAVVGTPRPPLKVVPPPIVSPKHEERPIPRYEPPRALAPPRGKK
jgi:hypothetical protein